MKNFKSHDQARQLVTKYIKQIEELSNLVTDANRFLAQPEPPKQDSIREQIKKLELNIAGLTQRLEALEQRTQPSDTKILEAAQALVDAIANQVNTNLSWNDVNLNLLVPGYLLEDVRPLFNKSTQPSEKGE